MSNTRKRFTTRAAAGAVASALVLPGLVSAVPASAAALFETERLQGADRYGTAADAALTAFPDGADTVVVASGEVFPDALAGSFVAGLESAPILLTRAGDLPDQTAAAIETLGATNVILLGGPARVSAAVQAELATLAGGADNVRRIAGANRYGTAAMVAAESDETAADERVAFLATGETAADALAVGPLAYAAGIPILLTAPNGLPAETAAAMRDLGIDRVVPIGGTAAISDAVLAALPQGVQVEERLQGANRRATAVAVANFAVEELGFDETGVVIANGDSFADALSVAPLAGQSGFPLLLTAGPGNLGAEAQAYLTANQATLVNGFVAGGPAAVSTEAVTAIETAAGAANPGEGPEEPEEPTNAVTITNATTVQPGGTLTGTVTGNPQSVTVSGCGFTAGTAVTMGANGALTFPALPASQAAGNCTLTFTITPTGGGQAITQTVTVNVQAAPGVTVRPELVSAAIVSTTPMETATQTNPAGTVVRYTFDENVASAAGATAGLFRLYNADGTPAAEVDPGATGASVTFSGNAVSVLFPALQTAESVGNITLGTVTAGAVADTTGLLNPIGDAPLGTAGGGNTALPAGVTNAPDLVSISAPRATATANEVAVDFTFDEAAFVTMATTAANFALVLTDNTEVVATSAPAPGSAPGDAPAGTRTVVGGNQTTTLTLIFTNPTPAGATAPTPLTSSNIARASIAAGSVSDAGTEGNTNVLQVAEVANGGNTSAPDLVSVQLRPATTTTGADQAIFTFDQPVQNPTSASFGLYSTGTTTAGPAPRTGSTTPAAVVNTADPRQVLVTFETGTAATAVGGFVLDNAVTAGNVGEVPGTATNQQDEVGVANQATGAMRTPGQTAGPDLMSVTLSQGQNEFGTATEFQATFTFDEALLATGTAPTPANFQLVLADGTILTGATGAAFVPPAAGATTTNAVVVTGFTTNATGTPAATSAQIGAATLGTVTAGAATEATGGAATNPEGASRTTGGTGTPQS